MNTEQERLKVSCLHCKKDIILTFNTTKCPKCGQSFKVDEVHQVFYDYESQIANSRAHNAANKINSVSEGTRKTGNWLQDIGCVIFLLPLTILLLIFIFQMLF